MNQKTDEKFKKISDYGDRWTLLEGQLDEKPIITRYKETLVGAVGHPDYPFQIGIAIPLLDPADNGLPALAEGQQLSAIEDLLVDTLEEKQEAVHVMTITFNNMREFVFYASREKPQYFEQKVKSVAEKITTKHHIQFMMQLDKQWDTFRKYSGQQR